MNKNETVRSNSDGADMALKVSKLFKKLITCLSQETLALQSHNRAVAEKMNQEKTRLMHSYKAVQGELKDNPTLFKNLDTDIKKHLQELSKEFETVLKDNMLAVVVGKKAVTRLIDRILEKVREASSMNTKSYNNSGRINESRMSNKIIPTTLNETY